ncbi:carbohydrate ABC transporter permease [Microvirga subterranea]|uniref:Carbohydrate ABC transporter membrane protein 1 (CUT1 family) n=1 Tax=Microvirga subterranea TaxID=186651 RepID=A0A370HPL5_9HYPH|nr:sugar ABC transporter permease [Microvirga subterranea]RDI60185.1 carbohydrate ABC transporter membrane protein 1 (CUT1 family) [Microvirga subterranea]
MTDVTAPGLAGAATRPRGRASSLTRTRVRSAWAFIAPALVVLVLVAGWPLARTIWFSFTDADLNNLSDYTFIGFENYLANYDGEWLGLLTDPDWWRSVWNTLWFTLVSVSIETVLGIVVALILNAHFPGRGIMRAVILIPWAIPTVVSAKMWNWMLHDQFGVINDMLLRLGIIAAPITWTANPDTALWTVVMVDVWKTTPFMALLILAALQMLPQDIYEAAKVDGVHPMRVFFRVTLPLIKPALLVAVIFRALDALRVFDLIYVLTANSKDTMSMSVFARQQLVEFQEVGLGSAASTLIFLIIALLVAATLVAGRVRLGEETR